MARQPIRDPVNDQPPGRKAIPFVGDELVRTTP
jgi:hypothetical protein